MVEMIPRPTSQRIVGFFVALERAVSGVAIAKDLVPGWLRRMSGIRRDKSPYIENQLLYLSRIQIVAIKEDCLEEYIYDC